MSGDERVDVGAEVAYLSVVAAGAALTRSDSAMTSSLGSSGVPAVVDDRLADLSGLRSSRLGWSRRTGSLCTCEHEGPRDAFPELRAGFSAEAGDSNPRDGQAAYQFSSASMGLARCRAESRIVALTRAFAISGVPLSPTRSAAFRAVRLQIRLQPPGVGHGGQCSPRYGSG
jgi:hypothetical protein